MAESITAAEGKVGADALVLPGGGPAPAVHTASLFRGRGEYAIDDKGRLTLPPQMRGVLKDGGSLVVLDGRAVIWAESTYRAAVDALRQQVTAQQLSLTKLRAFLSNTHPISPDAQGRIVVPHAVRIEAGLERDVLVLGAGPRIEIVPAGDRTLDELMAVDDEVVDALDLAGF